MLRNLYNILVNSTVRFNCRYGGAIVAYLVGKLVIFTERKGRVIMPSNFVKKKKLNPADNSPGVDG